MDEIQFFVLKEYKIILMKCNLESCLKNKDQSWTNVKYCFLACILI